MQYRTFKFKELPEPYSWFLTKDDGSQEEFKNYDTLAYAAGGPVSSYEIDNDYTVANNSTINIVAKTAAVAGQLVALIDDAGAYDIGVITSVDNENLKILYKSLLALFDGDILNPTRANQDDESAVTYLYDGVDGTARILASYFAKSTTDKYKRLPIRVRTSGGGKSGGKYNVPAIWDYEDNTVNLRDWLVELFNKHNVVLQFRLIFETSRAYIEIYVMYNTTGGRLLKNNIHGLTITHTEESSAKATVCQVIDKDTKALLSTWYLLVDNTVTSNKNASNRVQPYKLTVAELDRDNDDGATAQTVAEDALKYSDFNHYISVKVDKNSKMIPKNLSIGDAVTIVTETDEMTAADQIDTNCEDRVWKSIYTGRKENSRSSEATLIFGKIRINYTDIIQMREMKKVR